MTLLFAAIPLPFSLFALAVLGAIAGGLVNWAVYALAWNARAISPWSRSPAGLPSPSGLPPRGWADRLPIVGWLRLRRESKTFGPGHWIRPLIVELALGGLFAWLYWWEVERGELVVSQLAGLFGLTGDQVRALFAPPSASLLVQPYAVHLVLILFMLVASLIDIDERLTSDAVMVPGTLLGLVIAAIAPWTLLPWVDDLVANPWSYELLSIRRLPGQPEAGVEAYRNWLTLAAPNAWPFARGGDWAGLAFGLGCYALWCFAMLPRPWYGRHGWRRALKVCTARMVRGAANGLWLVLTFGGLAAIAGVWRWGDERWAALLTALVGMIVSGGVVWAIRLIGKAALGKEAMGFGDVLFMMMVGAYLGWQAGVLVFFIAPLVALVFGLINWLSRREREIFYVPFLAFAALLVVVFWGPLFDRFRLAFSLGKYLLLVGVVCVGMVGFLLAMIRTIQGVLIGRG